MKKVYLRDINLKPGTIVYVGSDNKYQQLTYTGKGTKIIPTGRRSFLASRGYITYLHLNSKVYIPDNYPTAYMG